MPPCIGGDVVVCHPALVAGMLWGVTCCRGILWHAILPEVGGCWGV